MFKKFKKLILKDFESVERFQDNVDAALNLLPSIEIIQGRLVQSLALKAGQTNVIDHKLGRAPLGWFVTRQKSNAVIWDTQDDNRTPTLSLYLNSSADVSVDIWVF